MEHSHLDVRLMDTPEKFNGHSGTPVDTIRTTTQWKLMPWEREEERLSAPLFHRSVSLHASAVSLRLESEAALLPQLASAQRRLCTGGRVISRCMPKYEPAVSNRTWALLRKVLELNLRGGHFTHKLNKRLNDTVPNSAATGETLGDRILIGISRKALCRHPTMPHCNATSVPLQLSRVFKAFLWNAPTTTHAHDDPMDIYALDKERRRHVPWQREGERPGHLSGQKQEQKKRQQEHMTRWHCGTPPSLLSMSHSAAALPCVHSATPTPPSTIATNSVAYQQSVPTSHPASAPQPFGDLHIAWTATERGTEDCDSDTWTNVVVDGGSITLSAWSAILGP